MLSGTWFQVMPWSLLISASRSPAINLEDIGTVHFRLPSSDSGQQVRLMRADVKIDGPTIFVFLDEATEGWPFKIENDSDYSFSFSQNVRNVCYNTVCSSDTSQDQSRANAGPTVKPMPTYTVPQKSSLEYAWDAPAARDKRILLHINGSRREVDIMEIGDLVPFRFAVSTTLHGVGKMQLRLSNRAIGVLESSHLTSEPMGPSKSCVSATTTRSSVSTSLGVATLLL